MKLPSKVRSIIDELEGLKPSDKAKLLRHLGDMEDSLPEHPTPAEANRIVKGALKKLEISVGKEEKKEEKKEDVKESKKLSFKAFLNEAKYIFKKINYDQFERLVNSSLDYEEDYIDGRRVICAYKDKNCIGMFYPQKNVGSSCPNFKGDALSYSEQDSYWPWA